MIRIQIATHNILKAEAIVESLSEADKLWSRYSISKWRLGKPIGGAIIQLSTLPRFWNVKIGDEIN